jgi:hypothetical protein
VPSLRQKILLVISDTYNLAGGTVLSKKEKVAYPRERVM